MLRTFQLIVLREKKPTCSMQNKILKTFAVCSLGFLIHCGSVGTFKCVE